MRTEGDVMTAILEGPMNVRPDEFAMVAMIQLNQQFDDFAIQSIVATPLDGSLRLKVIALRKGDTRAFCIPALSIPGEVLQHINSSRIFKPLHDIIAGAYEAAKAHAARGTG